jgi:hypothetical protein
MHTFIRGNKTITVQKTIKSPSNKVKNKPRIVHTYPIGIFSTPVIEKRYISQ